MSSPTLTQRTNVSQTTTGELEWSVISNRDRAMYTTVAAVGTKDEALRLEKEILNASNITGE